MSYKLRRALALLLAALLLSMTLSGCGMPAALIDELIEDKDEQASPSSERIIPLTDSYWFDYSYRGYTAYEDMPAYLEAPPDIESYTDLLRCFTSGGEYQDFEDAYFLAQDELYRIYTAYTVADISYSSDPTDEAAAAVESAYAAWYAASDEFYAALGEVARSEHGASLLDELLGENTSGSFASYYPDESGGAEHSAEDELLHSYNVAMTSSEPDLQRAAEIFVELVKLRNEQAAAYGYSSYAELAYYEQYYRNYSPEEVAASVWPSVKEHFVPLAEKYTDRAAELLWQLYDDPSIDCSEEAVIEALKYVAPRLSQEAAEALDYMLEYGLYDISQSPTKLNTGFTTTLYYFNDPFLFNAAMGDVEDFPDTFHEFGHFLNAYATTSDLLYGMSDTDLSELQSQGMEMMFTHWYKDIFGGQTDAMLLTTLYDMLCSVIEGAMYDEFQQRAYAEPELTAERACELYLEVAAEYGRDPGEAGKYDWVYISHNFDFPYYYISYCMSALPALELYVMLQEYSADAADRYMHVVSLDTEIYYFDEALTECGFSNVFDSAAFASCADSIDAYLSEI